jgi:tetratricopeptide (TPR) repeat protein
MFIVTFYSYKGGVGRTMALANTAYRLSAKGKKVFVLDFDLEAPGLDAFFTDNGKHPGIVEYVSEYLAQGAVPPLRGFVCEVGPYPGFATRGSIHYMRAGKGDENYQELLARLNWKDFYAQSQGFLFVENLKGAIDAEYAPDYVLVDSRTGLTDVSGICTLQFPNLVVFLFALNKQNLEGVATIYKSVVRNKLSRSIETLLVASMVPDVPAYIKQQENRLLRAKECLARDPHLVLPYAPFAAFEETILPPNSGTHLGKAYDDLTEQIIRVNKSDLLSLLEEAKTLRREGNPEGAEAKYRQIVEGFPRSPEVWQSYGTFLRAIGKGPDALHAFETAIALGGKNANYAELAMTLFTTGDVHAAQGIFGTFLQRSSNPRQIIRYTSFFDDREADALAIAGYERAIELGDERPDWPPQLLLGNIHMRRKEITEAVECYKKALELQPNELAIVYNLGYALHVLGQEVEARQYLERSVQIYEQAQLHESLPVSRANKWQAMGQAYYALRNYGKAENAFRAALEASEKVQGPIFSSVRYRELPAEDFRVETVGLLRFAEEDKHGAPRDAAK